MRQRQALVAVVISGAPPPGRGAKGRARALEPPSTDRGGARRALREPDAYDD